MQAQASNDTEQLWNEVSEKVDGGRIGSVETIIELTSAKAEEKEDADALVPVIMVHRKVKAPQACRKDLPQDSDQSPVIETLEVPPVPQPPQVEASRHPRDSSSSPDSSSSSGSEKCS